MIHLTTLISRRLHQSLLRLWVFTAMPAIFCSCEKTISFRPNDSSSQVVVEATIENGQAPVVILSTSVNYFSKITPELLEASFIHDAVVEVSNGTFTQRLKEFTIPDSTGYDLYYYSVDPAGPGPILLGEFSTTYTLRITTGGKTYQAKTTIPVLTKRVDSMWWEPIVPRLPDTNLVRLMARVTDPPGFGNYIRYFTRVNQEAFKPGLNSVFDDQIIDGKTYNIPVDQGVNRNEELDFETGNLFSRGDTVTLKFCNIDKATFDFWRTMEYSYSSIGNPFASPAKVLTNVQGGALGYFGGYAVQYLTLELPR